MKIFTLHITGMRCVACASRAERALRAVSSVDNVLVSLARQQAFVRYDDAVISEEICFASAAEALRKCGLQASMPERRLTEQHTDTVFTQYQSRLQQCCVLVVLLLLCAVIPEAGRVWNFNFSEQVLQLLTAAQFALAMMFAVMGWREIKNGFSRLLAGEPAAESLSVLVCAASFLYSALHAAYILQGAPYDGGKMYFATGAAILLLNLWGQKLESSLASAEAESLTAKDVNETVTLLRGEEKVALPLTLLLPGDVVALTAGMEIPADGVVEQGCVEIDESALTGVTDAAVKQKGGRLWRRALVLNGAGTMWVTAVGTGAYDSELFEFALGHEKAKRFLPRAADKVAAVYLPVVLIIALVAGLSWYFGRGDSLWAWNVFIAALVMACPGLLNAAAPLAVLAGKEAAQKRGVFFKNVEVLERARQVTVAVLMKNNIVEDKNWQISEIKTYNGTDRTALLRLAISLTQNSSAPEALALRNEESGFTSWQCDKLRYDCACGYSGEYKGVKVRLGSAEYVNVALPLQEQELTRRQEKKEEKVLFAAAGGKLCGEFTFKRRIAQTAVAAVASLRGQNVRALLLTGDAKKNTAAADGAGVEKTIAELTPQEKAELVASMQQGGEFIAVLGGSLCDAAAVARADIGAAPSAAPPEVRRCAQIILQGDARLLPEAIAVSSLTARYIKQNLFLALAIHIISVPFAVGAFSFFIGWGLPSPLTAVMALAISAAAVFFNSQRLKNL